MNIDPRLLAITSFAKLAEAAKNRVEKDCFDKYICIETSKDNKTYIGFSFVLCESAIVCEVHGMYNLLDNQKIMSNAAVIQYIENLGSISKINVGAYLMQ